MTETQLRNDIDTKLTVPVTQVSKFKELFNSTVDFVLGQNKDDFPDWTAVLVFNTNGTGAGKYCKHPDTNGRKRIFETKTSGNVNNVPPTDPGVTENTHWKEISESASSGIPEYTPGVFGSGLKIVYHNHTSLGRRLFLLTEPVRPFTSANIETEIAAGKWVDFTIEESKVQALIANAVTGLYDLRGTYNASSNLFPAAGGSGNAGAILKGDIWIISVPGTLGGTPVVVDQHVLALVDAPGQTASNWQISKGTSTLMDYAVATGTNTYAVTLTPGPFGYTEGLRITVRFTNASTITNPTINVNGLGARTIVKRTNSALVTGDIAAGQIYTLVFDGTNFRMMGIANSATLNDVAITNQIESGKNVGVYIRSSDGQLTKLPWLEYDVTNRKVTITGLNNLNSGVSFEVLNSDLAAILRLFNDLRLEIGGTQFILEPNNSVPSGNARIRLNDNQAMGLIIEDKNGKEYVSFRTTDNDERFNIRVPRRLQTLGTVDSFYDEYQAQVTANAANGSTTLITSIAMPTDEEMIDVICEWNCISNAGVGGGGVVRHRIQRISGGTVQEMSTQTVADIKRTAGDFVVNIVADNTNKRVNINFVNNSSGGLAFKVTAYRVGFSRIQEPL